MALVSSGMTTPVEIRSYQSARWEMEGQLQQFSIQHPDRHPNGGRTGFLGQWPEPAGAAGKAYIAGCGFCRHCTGNLQNVNIVPQDIAGVLPNMINIAFHARNDKL